MNSYLSNPKYLQRSMAQQAAWNGVARPKTAPQSEGVLRRLARATAHRWQRGKMIRALQAMDDRLLRDIGIYRNDIPRVVDGLTERELKMTPFAPAAIPVETKQNALQKAA